MTLTLIGTKLNVLITMLFHAKCICNSIFWSCRQLKKKKTTAWTLFIPCGLNLSKLFFTSLDHKYLVMVTIIWPTSILVFMCLWPIYNAHQQILQFCWTRYAITEYLSRSTSIKLVSMSFWVEVNLCRYLICLYCILDFIINRGEF